MTGPDPSTLTDLEGAALAVIARDGSTTAYALTREFAVSPSQYWSGSAGAIYPLIARLRRRQLVVGASTSRGQRNATSVSITTAGRAALARWLLDVDRAADMGFDPLRTRLPFLTLVPEAARAPFLDAVARKTAALRTGGLFDGDAEKLGHNLSWLDARLAWLKKLGARIGRRGE